MNIIQSNKSILVFRTLVFFSAWTIALFAHTFDIELDHNPIIRELEEAKEEMCDVPKRYRDVIEKASEKNETYGDDCVNEKRY